MHVRMCLNTFVQKEKDNNNSTTPYKQSVETYLRDTDLWLDDKVVSLEAVDDCWADVLLVQPDKAENISTRRELIDFSDGKRLHTT